MEHYHQFKNIKLFKRSFNYWR